jgi:hypothetical protein
MNENRGNKCQPQVSTTLRNVGKVNRLSRPVNKNQGQKSAFGWDRRSNFTPAQRLTRRRLFPQPRNAGKTG